MDKSGHSEFDLRAYDSKLLDNECKLILLIQLERTGAKVRGPIPLTH